MLLICTRLLTVSKHLNKKLILPYQNRKHISDEFEAGLYDMFKVESGNEYRWLNKDARELKSGLLHIEDKLTLQRTDLESHDTNTSILPSINHNSQSIQFILDTMSGLTT